MNSFTANLHMDYTRPFSVLFWYKLPVLIIRSCSIVNSSRYYLLSIPQGLDEQILEEERSGKANDELKEK